MRRREFIGLLGGAAAAWPLGVRAQQPPLPIIGYISSASLTGRIPPGFSRGLNQGGYVQDKNVAIEFHQAEGQYDRLPTLAADMARRQVSLIVAAGGLMSAQAAKAATASIPIVFIVGFDPVKAGLVTSLNRPGGNATGVSVYTTELIAKRLELLRELVPKLGSVALLVNPGNSIISDVEIKDMEAVTQSARIELLVLKAGAESEFEVAFASAAGRHAGALLVSADPFFATRRDQIVALAARHAIPTAYPWREYVEVGGLMGYGPSIMERYLRVGAYAARILKGARPADLPVQLPTTFELTINLTTAKALGLTVSRLLLARADKLMD
jgi:putative ABC transport system substrate-binding protein